MSISSIYWQCKATFVFPHSFERNFYYCIWIIFLDFLSFIWLFENPDWLCRKIQVDWYKSNFQICIQWLKSVSAHILFLQKKEGQRVWRVSRSGFSRFVFRIKDQDTNLSSPWRETWEDIAHWDPDLWLSCVQGQMQIHLSYIWTVRETINGFLEITFSGLASHPKRIALPLV